MLLWGTFIYWLYKEKRVLRDKVKKLEESNRLLKDELYAVKTYIKILEYEKALFNFQAIYNIQRMDGHYRFILLEKVKKLLHENLYDITFYLCLANQYGVTRTRDKLSLTVILTANV